MGAFASPIVAYIFCVNAVAFVGLILIKTTASALGFAFPLGDTPNRREVFDK